MARSVSGTVRWHSSQTTKVWALLETPATTAPGDRRPDIFVRDWRRKQEIISKLFLFLSISRLPAGINQI
jgi:hypothetical protein